MGSKHKMKSTRVRFGGRRMNSRPASRLYFSRGQNTAVVLSVHSCGMVEAGGTPGCPAPRPAPSADLHGGGTSSSLGSPCQHSITLRITKWFGRKPPGLHFVPHCLLSKQKAWRASTWLCKEHPLHAARGRASLGEEDHHSPSSSPRHKGRSAEKSRASFIGQEEPTPPCQSLTLPFHFPTPRSCFHVCRGLASTQRRSLNRSCCCYCHKSRSWQLARCGEPGCV